MKAQHFRLWQRLLVTACALIIFSVLDVSAQTSTATLSGTVTDQSGALVAGAKVRVTDPRTGFQREAMTSADGYFVVPVLPPSVYKVRVEGAGFAPAEVNEVVLNANDRRSLQVSMRIGNVGEAVEIKADNFPTARRSSPCNTTGIRAAASTAKTARNSGFRSRKTTA